MIYDLSHLPGSDVKTMPDIEKKGGEASPPRSAGLGCGS